MARSDAKIKEGAAAFLEPGEEVVAAVVARPRGWTQAGASVGGGAIAGAVGGAIGGKSMKVQELLSAVPVAEVDSIEVKRLAMGRTVTVTVRGVPFTLEVGAGADANGVAEALERAKG